ncbi:MAG: REP-associated tyrosine transposase [Fimbriimonadales bacterium]
MTDYRRYFVPGGTFFFTLVTAERAPLFAAAAARTLLGVKMREQRGGAPFETVAAVLLHDHLHVIWTLPPGDSEYPDRWQAIKATFTAEWLSYGSEEQPVSQGYRRQRRRGIWQPRFIEHTIHDEEDLLHHADYIHYNPVKHAYVRRPRDWPWSSFHRYVLAGDYPPDWGCAELASPDFGDVDEGLIE